MTLGKKVCQLLPQISIWVKSWRLDRPLKKLGMLLQLWFTIFLNITKLIHTAYSVHVFAELSVGLVIYFFIKVSTFHWTSYNKYLFVKHERAIIHQKNGPDQQVQHCKPCDSRFLEICCRFIGFRRFWTSHYYLF